MTTARRDPVRLTRLLVAGALISLLAATSLSGQERSAAEVVEATDRLAAALHDSQRSHLWRVLWWGGANLALGVGISAMGRENHPTRFGFGVQTAAWGAINVGIATWGLLAGPELAVGPRATLAAEDAWSHILLVNLGLNVGYVAVGAALHIASSRGLRQGDAVRGHARAVMVQGVGLLVLDGIAWAASRVRLEELRGLAFSDVVVSTSAWDAGAIEVGLRIPFGG